VDGGQAHRNFLHLSAVQVKTRKNLPPAQLIISIFVYFLIFFLLSPVGERMCLRSSLECAAIQPIGP